MVISIQYLRGIASLLVLLEHIAWKGAQHLNHPLDWFHIGGGGVDIFFIISGFIMAFTTSGKYGALGKVFAFMKKRFLRILPLYWLLTIVALIVFMILPDWVNTSGGKTNIPFSFLLIPSDGKFLLQNGWTLSIEFYFYFLFAFGLIFRESIGRIVTFFILMSLFIIGLFAEPEGLYTNFLANPVLIEFVVGILIFYFYRRQFNIPIIIPCIMITVSIFLFVELNSHNGVFTRWRVVDFGIPSFLLCFGVVLLEKQIVKKKFKALQNLGDSSYSLYLVHPFVLSACALVINKFELTNRIPSFFIIFIWIFLSIFSGYLCYLFVENKMAKIIRGRSNAPE